MTNSRTPIDLIPGQEIRYRAAQMRKWTHGVVVDGKAIPCQHSGFRYEIRVNPRISPKLIPASWIRRGMETGQKAPELSGEVTK